MYLMYVDESGDSGKVRSPTTHFGLSGIVIHESQWRSFVNQISAFRKTLNAVYGLPMRSEIHASDYIRRPPVALMPPHIRLAILRNFLDELAKMNFISITNVLIDKRGKPTDYDVFDVGWRMLFQRFENTLGHGNFPGAHRNDLGLVLTDATDGKKLTGLVRKMAVYNPVPNMSGLGYRQMPMLRVIEDPFPKDSRDSYFIQACDVCAYFLTQHANPNPFVRQSGAQNYIKRLRPVLNLAATRKDPLGIVRL